MRWTLVLLLCSSAVPETVATESVLGLEPGELRLSIGLLSNDDMGIILWGPDDAPTLSVGKSDVWDRRNPAPSNPILTMDEIVRRAREGDESILNGKPYYSAYDSHDFPCPKPVGQLILDVPFIRDGGRLSYTKENGESIALVAEKGDKRLTATLFVSSVRNAIVIMGEGRNLREGDVSVRVYRHRDTILPGGELHPTIGGGKSPADFEPLPMPRAGLEGDAIWVAQDYFPEPTFPGGFTSVLGIRVMGVAVETRVVEGETGLGTPMIAPQEGRINHAITKRFTPINDAEGSASTAILGALNGPFAILATAATTQDAEDTVAYVANALDEAMAMGTDALVSEHRTQLAGYEAHRRARGWSADGQTLFDVPWGGVPYRVRPAGYYGDVSLCSVASTKFCFQDSSPWHGDFHFNEIDATGPCMMRQFDTLDSYFQMMLALLPMAQANARDVYGCAGAVYPLVHYPLKADTVIHVNVTWEQSMEITALLARPFWLRFQYTWDMAFLRDAAYPVLREGARFYSDFLKRDEDGVYHVFPTVSPEHRGITKDLLYNRDSQSGITLIRYHLRAAAEAAKLLEIDSEEAARWLAIADHMPAYPTVDGVTGPIFADVEGGPPMEFNIAVPLSSVFWGDDIGLDSPEDQVALAKRTLSEINVWEPHRGYLARVRARLGIYDANDRLGSEHFLQSHTGCIRVFPTVPEGFEGGFENIGAQGAFVVGATRGKDGVTGITLESLAGNRCTVANPWANAAVRVSDITENADVAVSIDDRYLRFDTRAGHRYRIAPTAE